VLLLHGFPDNAWTWERHLVSLADGGYRAVAPFLRGYPPTEAPADGRYDARVLADDVASLIHALDDESAVVVGHDWGAAMAYWAMIVSPASIRRSVVIAVNHPQKFAHTLTSPTLLHSNFHLWLFQLDGYAEAALQAGRMELIDHLWHFWSPGLDDREHLERVKEQTLSQPGALEAALGYYRALLALPGADPGTANRLIGEESAIATTTLAIFGSDDPIARPADGEEECFTGPYRLEVVEGAGHFVQRERPRELAEMILGWLESHELAAKSSGRGGKDGICSDKRPTSPSSSPR
jgi:pimeloyl-ACP methyl ester carboxylesterase